MAVPPINIPYFLHTAYRDVTPSQLSQVFHTRSLAIALMEIDHQEEIGDQSTEQLHQDTVWVSGDLSACLRAARRQACNAQAGEMIDLEVLFPPGEEGFNLPSERENEGDLPCGQVLSACLPRCGAGRSVAIQYVLPRLLKPTK